MAQMNGMEKRNFKNSARNGGKTSEMRNNSAKSGMVGMSEARKVKELQTVFNRKETERTETNAAM